MGAPVVEDKTTQNGQPGGDPPAKAPAAAPQAAPEKKDPPAAAKTEVPAGGGGAGEKKRVTLKGDDDDIPDDADLIDMTPRAFKARMNRHTKKELKERFGTDDPDEIQAKLKRLDALETAEKKRQEEELSDKQKLEKERDEALAAKTAAEERANQIHEQRIFDKTDSRVARIAEKYIDEDYIDVELPKLAAWLLRNHKKADLKTLKDSEIADYFKERVEKKPKLAKDYDERRDAERKKKEKEDKTKKVPLDNGANADDRPDPEKSAGGEKKTYAPNRANSMSSTEARAAAAKEGYRW